MANATTRPAALAALALLALVPRATATDIYWLSGAGGNFTNGANWWGGFAPGPSDNACFTNRGNYRVAWSAPWQNANACFNSPDLILTQAIESAAWLVTNRYVVGAEPGNNARVLHSSGLLVVTNEVSTAQLVVAGGAYALRGGTTVADWLFATNGLSSALRIRDGTLQTLHGSRVDMSTNLLFVGATAGQTGAWHVLGGTNIVLADGHLALGVEADAAGLLVVNGAGTVLSNKASLVVGDVSCGNQVVVSGGARLRNDEGILANVSASASNTVVVAGPGSAWENGGALRIGNLGGANRLIVTNGGRVSYAWAEVGDDTDSEDNLVLVTGSNSWLTTTGWLDVGSCGSRNRLVIENGGGVSNYDACIGATRDYELDSVSTSNSALVCGPGSRWLCAGDFAVGYELWTNSLVVSNGACVASDIGYLGYISGGNLAELVGSGTVWTSRAIYAGRRGPHNVLRVLDGARLVSDELEVGRLDLACTNTLLVSGTGTVCEVSGALTVGSSGQRNVLEVRNGAVLRTRETWLGTGLDGQANRMVVADSGTVWSNTPLNVTVGQAAPFCELVASNGASVAGAGALVLGGNIGGSNTTVRVVGANSTWLCQSNLYVGQSANACRLFIEAGGTLSNRVGYVGGGPAIGVTNAAAVVSGSGSKWLHALGCIAGYRGTGHSLVVTNQGLVSSSGGAVGYMVDADGNSAVVTGTGSVWRSDGSLFHVGKGGSDNALEIRAGGLVLVTNASVWIGENAGSDGNHLIVSGPGARLDAGQHLYVGSSGQSNRLTVADHGRVSTAGNVYFGVTSNCNSAVVAGPGTFWEMSQLYVGSAGSHNELLVTNGAMAHVKQNAWVSAEAGASNNAIVVAGAVLSLTNSATLTVGSAGPGALRLRDGEVWAYRLIVNEAGTLEGTGLVVGPATVSGALEPGASAGALVFSNNLTLANSTVATFEFAGAGTSDVVTVAGDFAADGVLLLDFHYVPDTDTDAFTIFRVGGTLAGDFDTVVWTGLVAGGTAGFEGNDYVVRPLFVDSDGDGLPDAWESRYFGGPTNAAPGAHGDADEHTNIEEYRAGTDPTNSASVLEFTQVYASDGDVILKWQSASNKTYAILSTTNLDEDFWPYVIELEAAPPENTYTDAPSANPMYYRIRTE